MNYIHELERENAALRARLKAKDDAAVAFIVFLHGPKFAGSEGGETKGRIATEDVIRWLCETNSASIHAEDAARAAWHPRIRILPKAA